MNTVPSFTVNQIGLYRIHTLVYDPATLNLGVVVFGQTTGFDVNSLLIQGGGSICASLDVQGAPTIVFGPIICSIFNLNSVATPDLSEQTIEELKSIAESGVDGQIAITNVYPNPASEFINVELLQAGSGNINISIFNTVGQQVFSKQLNGMEGMNTDKINISTLAPGNYLLKVDNGIDSVSRMFVIQD